MSPCKLLEAPPKHGLSTFFDSVHPEDDEELSAVHVDLNPHPCLCRMREIFQDTTQANFDQLHDRLRPFETCASREEWELLVRFIYTETLRKLEWAIFGLANRLLELGMALGKPEERTSSMWNEFFSKFPAEMSIFNCGAADCEASVSCFLEHIVGGAALILKKCVWYARCKTVLKLWFTEAVQKGIMI